MYAEALKKGRENLAKIRAEEKALFEALTRFAAEGLAEFGPCKVSDIQVTGGAHSCQLVWSTGSGAVLTVERMQPKFGTGPSDEPSIYPFKVTHNDTQFAVEVAALSELEPKLALFLSNPACVEVFVKREKTE